MNKRNKVDMKYICESIENQCRQGVEKVKDKRLEGDCHNPSHTGEGGCGGLGARTVSPEAEFDVDGCAQS